MKRRAVPGAASHSENERAPGDGSFLRYGKFRVLSGCLVMILRLNVLKKSDIVPENIEKYAKNIDSFFTFQICSYIM